MSEYTIKQGDTFESVSRKTYGTEENTSTIRKANPSVSDNMQAGTVVFIPATPRKSKVSVPDDRVTVLIDGIEFEHFTSVTLTERFDSFDICDFVAPFEPENKVFRETFRPFSYKDIEVFIGNEIVFSGTMMSPEPSITPESRTVTISAYSRCAVINDSCVPITAYPFEIRGFKLDKIAKSVTAAFPFDVVSDIDVGAAFRVATIETDKRIAPFLTELARQRDIVITNNCDGNLLLTKAIDSEPIAFLKDDQSPVISISPRFSDQNYYSDYTSILPIVIRQNPTSYTAKNNKLTNTLRVDNYKATDALNGDEKVVAESRRARGLANSIAYKCNLSTIRDPSGSLYSVGKYVNMTAPTSMIYNDTKLFIRGVNLTLEHSRVECSLDLVLPESYNGKDVEVLPWEEK